MKFPNVQILFQKMLSKQSTPRIPFEGTLDGTFDYSSGSLSGEVIDRRGARTNQIDIFVIKGGKQLLSCSGKRVEQSNKYRFALNTEDMFSPADLISEKVSVVARSPSGASGTLRISGNSGLEIIREFFSVPAETLVDIRFAKGGNSQDYCGIGWSSPEIAFTWTKDDYSLLNIPTIQQSGHYALRVVSGAFVVKPFLPSQMMEIFLNDELIGSHDFYEGNSQFIEFKFSAENFIAKQLELRIHHPGASRPSDLMPTSQDTRRLAFCVKRVTLVRFI